MLIYKMKLKKWIVTQIYKYNEVDSSFAKMRKKLINMPDDLQRQRDTERRERETKTEK